MKTKKLLVLPLVALLAACNKAPVQDAFKKVRKQESSYADSTQLEDKVTAFSFVTKYHFVTRNYYKSEYTNNQWEFQSADDPITRYTRTDYSRGWHIVTLSMEQSENYVEDNLVQLVQVRVDGSNVTINENNYQYEGTPEQLYGTIRRSIFSWEASFFAGATFYLAAKNGSDFMPQEALNKLTKKFTIARDENVLTIMGGDDKLVYKAKGGSTVAIEQFKAVYEDHLLIQYNAVLSYSFIRDNSNRQDLRLTIDTNNVECAVA